VVLGGGAKPDGETGGAKPIVGIVLRYDAAAGGEDESFVSGEELFKAAALEAAESGLPVEVEEEVHGEAAGLFDELVEFEKRKAEFFGEKRTDGGLAGATESDEGDAVSAAGVNRCRPAQE
jgi:hypothetical protein